MVALLLGAPSPVAAMAATMEAVTGSYVYSPLPPAGIVEPVDAALRQVTTPPTAEEAAEQTVVRQRGTSDRAVIAEGTIAHPITLDDGFCIMYRDSGGKITEWEKAAMERI